MRIRLDLQFRILILMIGGMGVILLVSSYFYGLETRLLIEDDRYDTALSQTTALATRIVSEQLLLHPAELADDLLLLKTARPDFRQIDVYTRAPAGPRLVASTTPAAARVPVLDEQTPDNELGEMERPAHGVVTMEVLRGGVRHWQITVEFRTAEGPAYVSALVVKASNSPLIARLGARRNLVLAGAIAVSAGLSFLVFVSLFRRPARQIVAAMQSATAGDAGARAEVRRNDELGDIARGFNALMDELAARQTERDGFVSRISQFNEELTREVARATGELREVNDALFQAQQRLARTEGFAAVGQVAASLAHEIGTPLNSIGGHVQLLAKRFPDDTETQRRTAIISGALGSIVTSVRTLLWRVGRPRPQIRPTDLAAVIADTLRLVGPTLDLHRVHASVRLSTSAVVLADAERLQHVLLNLVNNAVEAIASDGRLWIETRLDDDGRTVQLSVRDDGPGVAPAAVDHLFEQTWTTKASGSGFGLAISREIMHAQGGRLDFVPGDGAGATFVVRLPVAEPPRRTEDTAYVAAN